MIEVQHPELRTVTSTRTYFPEIGSSSPDGNTLLVGCLKAMEETRTPGMIFLEGDKVRLVTNVTVKLSKPA